MASTIKDVGTDRMVNRLVIVCVAMLFVPIAHAADRSYVSACWQKTFEGSKESRAKRAARRACREAGHDDCRVVDQFCFDARHCFATVESCQEYEGRGSNQYRALRHALRQCQEENSHCRINGRAEAKLRELNEEDA